MSEQSKSVLRIDRVAGLFEVWLGSEFPFAKMRIKVLERGAGDFLAVPNVCVRSIVTRDPVHVSGLGSTVQEALDDLIKGFVRDSRLNTPADGLSESNFEWAAPEDF